MAVELVVTAEVGDPGRVDLARIEGGKAFVHAAFTGLAHAAQASALQAQAFQAGVLQGDAAKALGQQARVAVGHDRGEWEHVAGLDHRVQHAQFRRAADFAVAVFRLVVAVHRQHAERAFAAAAAAARVKGEAVHGECVQAKTHGALGKTGFEFANKALGPGFGIAIASGAGLALAVIAVEVEIARQHVDAAALDKTLGLVLHRHGGHGQCSHQ